MGNTNLKPITDEEIALNPNLYRDEDGVHMRVGRGTLLIESSDIWKDKNKYTEVTPEYTQEDFMLDLEFRVSKIEMGL